MKVVACINRSQCAALAISVAAYRALGEAGLI
jgi:hypothetical protein